MTRAALLQNVPNRVSEALLHDSQKWHFSKSDFVKVRKLEASQNPTRCGNGEVYSHSPEIRMLQRFANGSLSPDEIFFIWEVVHPGSRIQHQIQQIEPIGNSPRLAFSAIYIQLLAYRSTM